MEVVATIARFIRDLPRTPSFARRLSILSVSALRDAAAPRRLLRATGKNPLKFMTQPFSLRKPRLSAAVSKRLLCVNRKFPRGGARFVGLGIWNLEFGIRRRVCLFVAAMTLFVAAAEARDVAGRVVDADGQPLADAVVFVSSGVDEAAVAEREPATMDQVHKQYVPHVLPIAVGTEVRFPNYDQIHHHVYSFSKAKTFEIPLYKGGPAPSIRFDTPGAVVLGCNIHDWMSGVILVLPTTHFAKTDESGSFVLRDLPEQPLEISVWHERSRGDPSQHTRIVTPSAEASPLTIELAVEPPRQRPAWHGTRTLR